jgi:hypothetical protein
MDFLPDILDHLGKTPREFGALHAHFDSVTTIDGPRVVAHVLFQGAFHPMPAGAQIAFHAASASGATGEQLGCYDVPTLAAGAMRVSYPLRVPSGSTHVVAFIQAPPPSPRAERVRPAWKLHDTFEIPKLSEMEPVRATETGLNVGASLVGTALMGGAGFVVAFNLSTTTLAANTKTTLHKARELPPWLLQEISPRMSTPIDRPLEEVLWVPGSPLPLVAQGERVVAHVERAKTTLRRCIPCGFEGPSAEYERARSCPSCGEPWA